MLFNRKVFLRIPSVASLASLAMAAWLSSCMSNSGPTSVDIKTSDSTTAAATANLNGAIDQLSSAQFQYGQGNLDSLTAANADFQQALTLNPNNSEANLGAALTGVLLAAQSPGLSSELNNTVGAGSPLNMNLAKNAPQARVEILRKVAAQAGTPKFSQIQDTVASVLLPALEKAIAELQIVYNDPTFSMTLQIDGSPRKLGHSEAAVLLAGFKATHALATLLLSYDYDIDQNGSYAYLDTLGNIQNFNDLSSSQISALTTLTTLLSPGSPFLAVRAGWSAQLASVDPEIQSALGVLQAGLATVKTQADTSQINEIIHLCSKVQDENCIQDNDFDSALTALDSVSKYMNQPYLVTDIATGAISGDTSINVNFAAFFSVQDYKKMLPYYAFYQAGTWDSANPVVYFTNTAGTKPPVTGSIYTVSNILNNSDNSLTPAQQVAQLKTIIYWQDPTFQGFLPGATSNSLWRVIQKELEANQANENNNNNYYDGNESSLTTGLPHPTAVSLLSPNFALSLLGQ